ncbi:hypothetical protein [Limosilactobacillus mucosae]|uniref:Flagellar assembly protein H n=1 Tax=Limosilactobacillus mucosae TaxID=97478 RepID=A0A508YP69_LIMMU|nr:hypothetical protein [Limosilactobacillus mucosae]VTZ90281.1 hypothetical protein LMUP508_01101 [Limosilactobacillus mucosae]
MTTEQENLYQKGFEEGYRAGYTDGYQDGMTENDLTDEPKHD